MSNEPPKDPGEAFREMVTQWERGFDELANRFMGTEEYSRSMNQFQDWQLRARKAFQDFMSQNLTYANMPTRDDIVRVAEAVQGLEKRLGRIEDLLETAAGATGATEPARKSPPRTKQPPSATAQESTGQGEGGTP